jgi:hypothetical protein
MLNMTMSRYILVEAGNCGVLKAEGPLSKPRCGDDGLKPLDATFLRELLSLFSQMFHQR